MSAIESSASPAGSASAAAAAEEKAVIFVGATSVLMVIGSPDGKGGFDVVEHLDRPLPFARDIFRTGGVTRSTVEQAANILRDYRLAVRDYGLGTAQVRLYNTNILLEASNYEIFLNRLQVTSGLIPRLIDDGDMTRLVYQCARRLLVKDSRLKEGSVFFTHIGPGNTRALHFTKGRLTGYSNYRLGIFRAREAVNNSEDEAPQSMAYLEEQIRGVVDHLAQDYSGTTIDHHVAIGAEIQSVAPLLGTSKMGTIRLLESDLEKFTEKLSRLTPDELVRRLHVNYTGGEGIVAALQTNLALARRFGDDVVLVPDGDFQRELLIELMTVSPQTAIFQDEVMQAAVEVGGRYKTDRKHADHVAMFAQQLFRELQHLHALEPKYELVLRVAATLHEVGMFVSPRGHHKHSLYLLLNTELFGLSVADRTLVALLARYHRRYNPEPGHPHFADLSREERMVVFKLAAILRVADALDRSHAQRIRTIQLRTDGSRLLIQTRDVDDTTVEQIAINSKCDLFREIYGYEVILSKP